MFGPVFLLAVMIITILIIITLRLGVLDSIINGGSGLPISQRTRALSFTIIAVLIIMTGSLAIEGIVVTIQNAL